MNKLIRYFLENKLITVLLLLGFVGWGAVTAPFGWKLGALPSDPVPVDAIPDIGENQQIVFTPWPGRSPQDIEDQISYPLTTYLLGIPGVKTIRSNSIFGFSSIYIIFREDIEFYWSRSRILEKLSSLPAGLLPVGVQPSLGPDATALGQIYWYTLEGRDPDGKPTGGWDLHEIRTVQDFQVKYALNAAEGVAEVASIGGFVQEYQIDVNPDALKAYNVPLHRVMQAVQRSNRDIGAKTVEINQAEYLVRGLGYVKSTADLEQAVVAVQDNVPIRIKDIAVVSLGPATRRGALDKDGAEVAGGVVVARYGANPLEVIGNVKEKIAEIAPGLPKKTLADGTESQLTVVPFYDRSELIYETLGTLEEALSLQVLITILVIVVLIYNLRAAFLISSLLPIAILMVFIAMRNFGVDANIVALSGIAIAIGTMVDLGIILTENIVKHLDEAPPEQKLIDTIYNGAAEVSSAILTAVSTTVVSFIPVFALQATEGKLFGPLAYTKIFALIAALLVSLLILPTLAHWFFGLRVKTKSRFKYSRYSRYVVIFAVVWLLARFWMPLGPARSVFVNLIFVAMLVGSILGGFAMLEYYYKRILGWCLQHKAIFLAVPVVFIALGVGIWLNTGKEFMPALDEGSFLLMPTSMPHSGIEYNRKTVAQLDMLVSAIPEVELVVGKLGRADSALDPAPISMFENIVNYKPEYIVDDKGRRLRFKTDGEGRYLTKNKEALSQEEILSRGLGVDDLIRHRRGANFRNWRPHIRSPDDIWAEIVSVVKIPGVTSAPKLQPIETRLVMLQTGMRAPMGIKVFGPDLATIEDFGMRLENILKQVPSVKAEAVFADRIVGKPYIHLNIQRERIARYGLNIEDVQQVIETAIGGMPLSYTVEGRERFPVRVRYPRELRDSPDAFADVLVPTPVGAQVPLGQLVEIEYVRGPMAIKSENTFLVGYVLFDKKSEYAEVDVVEAAKLAIEKRIAVGELAVPAGVSYRFSGSYENQVRAEKRLSIIIPLVLALVFLILYFQFRSVATALMVFAGIAMAFSGGFLALWLYGQDWFMNFSIFGSNIRDLFQMHSIHLSVAVWVGFIALFGLATDDGVLMATYLDQSFARNETDSLAGIRAAVVEAGARRIKPAVMTSATTIIALLPVLTSTGRGADIMVPMAIPAFGGMLLAAITYFVLPVLYCWREESKLKKGEG